MSGDGWECNHNHEHDWSEPECPIDALLDALVASWRQRAFERHRQRDIDNVLNECADELQAIIGKKQ